MIVGLDIGRATATAAALTEFPKNIQKHFKEHKSEIKTFKANREGAEFLLSLKPQAIIMEPTGFWYSQFWYQLAKVHSIKVYWVGHADLAAQRNSYGFTNKSDPEDALCLAACYFDERFIDEHDRKRFLRNYLPDEILEVREIFYKIEQLDKLRGGMVSQLRQRLCIEFPELAEVTMQREPRNTYSPSIGWIAGIHKHTKLENRWKKSKSKELELGITPYTREHAAAIVDIEVRTYELEKKLEEILEREHFAPYMKAFDLFGFGQTMKSLLLLQCYPFDRFLINGKPYTEKDISKTHKDKNGKWQPGGKRVTRHISLRDFQAFMGLSYSMQQSGNSIKKKFHGSKLVRAHIYAFLMARIANGQQNPKCRTQSPLGQELGKTYDEHKNSGIHGKDGLTRTMFTLTRKLFYELWKEFKTNEK